MTDTTKLNRIKIKDMFASLKKDINLDTPFGLLKLEFLDRIEQDALENPDSESLQKVEQFFIEKKLDIKYYPSQNRKVLSNGKVVPIDKAYG